MDRINVQNLDYAYSHTYGSEAYIHNTKDGIFKRFLTTMPKEAKNVKEKKLILLDEIDSVKDYYANVLTLVDSFTGEFLSGYVMKKCEGYPIDEIFLTLEEKINALKQLKNILKKFEENGIIYEDIHFGNIFYDEKTSKVKLIDIDNIRIGNYGRDTLSFLTKHYIENGGKDDNKSRIYIFNLITYMIVSSCMKQYEFDYLLKTRKKFINNKDANKLMDNLFDIKLNTSCDNEYLIDMIDEKMLIK